jgi:PTS system mannose-specific IIA component
MIGILLVTHGDLGQALIDVVVHVMGPQPSFRAVGIYPDSDMEAKRKEISDTISELDQGEGVLILTDMFGGTPSNLAIAHLNRSNTEVIAGVNVPMLVKIASIRSTSNLFDLCCQAQEAGRKYMTVASLLLAS